MSDQTINYIQAGEMIVKGSVLFLFGVAIIAWRLKLKHSPFHWPIPGAYVGAAFLMVDALQPFHMAATRLGWLPWGPISYETTALYGFIALNSAGALMRWWRQGFEDAPGPWDGRPGGWSGHERRVGPADRRETRT